MIVRREIAKELKSFSEISAGDVIWFMLSDGEEVEAMCMKIEIDGAIFAFVDCIADKYPMSDPEGEGKDVAGALKDLYENRFPEAVKSRMIPFEDGSMLRLMSQKEVFGENYWCDDEPEDVTQFEPMRDRRNRIADRGYRGSIEQYEWYWLSNVVSAASFAVVASGGYASYHYASGPLGVRPAFKLSRI